jgi:hypothetical protein
MATTRVVLRRWIFRIFAAPAEGMGRNGLPLEDRPALLLLAGSRSALGLRPHRAFYPPLKQRVDCNQVQYMAGLYP